MNHLADFAPKGAMTRVKVGQCMSKDAARLVTMCHQNGDQASYFLTESQKHIWFDHKNIKNAVMPTNRNIFFSVNPMGKGRRRTKENVVAINVFFADLDKKDFAEDWSKLDAHIASLPIPPSVKVKSGNGYHCYWFFTETVKINDENREKWSKLQAQWVDFVKGDKNCKDIARILRVPNTINCKKGEEKQVLVCAESTWTTYDVDELITAMGHKVVDSVRVYRDTIDNAGDADNSFYNDNAKPDKVIEPTPRPMQGGIDAGAKALIDVAIAKMQGAIADHNRNQSLNDASLTIGGLVGANRITRDEGLRIIEQLKQIAIGKGLPLGEVEKTSKSGFEGGILKPIENRPMPTSTATATTPTPTSATDENIEVTREINTSSFAATDYDNAKSFVLLYPERYRYNPKVGWLRYDEKRGIWRRDNAEPLLAQDIADMLEKRQSDAVKARKNDIVTFCKPNAARIASTRTLLESLCYFELDEFDKYKDHVCATNCVINLRNGQQLPHSPHWGFTASVTADLNPDANDYLINDFLMQAVKGGEAVVRWLQKTGGSCLSGERFTEAATFLWGPSRAGKGSYAEAKKTLFGDLCHTLSFSALVEKRDPDSNNFDLAPLRGARLVIADESNRKDRLNGGKLKAMTGGNHIHCAFKGKDFFDYRPDFKIMMISNWPPNCDPDDDAAWGRLRVVEFPNSHLGSEDVTVKTRLKTREYQEALLKWLVLGAMAMYAENDGHIPPVPQVITSTNEARNALDTIQQWLDQCTIKRDDLYTESAKLYQNYAQWAENMGFEAKSSRNLMQTLRAKGFDTSAQKWAEGRNLRVTTGLGLLFS